MEALPRVSRDVLWPIETSIMESFCKNRERYLAKLPFDHFHIKKLHRRCLTGSQVCLCGIFWHLALVKATSNYIDRQRKVTRVARSSVYQSLRSGRAKQPTINHGKWSTTKVWVHQLVKKERNISQICSAIGLYSTMMGHHQTRHLLW